MLQKVIGLVLGGAVVAGLAGCVPTTASQTPEATEVPAGPVIKQPVPEDFVNAYAARTNDAFPIPAVPEDKIPAHLRRQLVDYVTDDPVGTIIIDPTGKTLHLVTAPGKAMRYGIAVGAEGFQWSGESLITGRRHWPTWTPPKEMISRKPELAKWEKGQPGGPTNPLGARALYLTTNGVDHGFRIHGTPEWKSIGRNASSGCFRMINQDVIDLYDRVPNGVKVVVLNADGTRPNGLKLPPPKPVKKAAPKPAPEAVTPAVTTPAEAPAATDPANPGPANPGAPAPGFPVMTTPVQPLTTGPAAPVTIAPQVGTPETPAPAAATPGVPDATVPAPAAVAPAAAVIPAPIIVQPPAATPTPVIPAAPAPTAAAPAACVATADKPCP